MQEIEVTSRVAPGMDVCDANGDRVGAVARLHQPAAVGGGDRGAIVEVKTGFFGLGKQLYVPASGVMDVSEGCLFLSAAKDALDALGWHDRPLGLDDVG